MAVMLMSRTRFSRWCFDGFVMLNIRESEAVLTVHGRYVVRELYLRLLRRATQRADSLFAMGRLVWE